MRWEKLGLIFPPPADLDWVPGARVPRHCYHIRYGESRDAPSGDRRGVVWRTGIGLAVLAAG